MNLFIEVLTKKLQTLNIQTENFMTYVMNGQESVLYSLLKS